VSSKNLGRGIEALISSNVKDKSKKIIDPGVSYVKVSEIKPNPNQPRRNFDSKALDELSNSINEKGVITPIQ
jgi:Predicted transcriptional regulators